jgi:hypothetical protein
MGVVFCLVILAMSEEGIALLEGRFDNSKDDDDDDDDVDGAIANVYVDGGIGDNNEYVDIVSTTDFIELIESFLAFYAWYKKDDYWSVTNAAYAKGRATMLSNSLKNMMDMVKRVLPRKEGNGWDVQNFHEMLYLIHDMTRYGAPMNFDSGTGKN